MSKIVNKLLKKLEKNPRDIEANKLLGHYFVEKGDYEKSLLYYSAALLEVQNAENYYNLGVSLHHTKKIDEALIMYNECLNLNSNFAEAYSNRAAIYRDKYNFHEALTNYIKAIELKPDKIDEYLNFAIVLFNLNKYEDALKICNYAISKGGITERKLLLKYEILFILGKIDETPIILDKLLKEYPQSPKVLWANACNNLIQGNFRDGWSGYESRWLAELGLNELITDKPKWLGNFSINGLTLLVHAEQGLGDTIQFCRYLKELKKFNANVIFQVQQPLYELLKNIDKDIVVISSSLNKELPKYDVHTPLLSLPLALNTELHNIPASIPYIFSDSTKSSFWKSKFNQLNLIGFKVGLVWNGGFRPGLINEHARNERRNMSIDHLICLSDVNALFFSLQKGEPSESQFKEVVKNWNGPQIINFMDEVNNFTDTAAIIDQLDLVISVDTSTAHLAAAMGKKVWLLNRVDSCWRWILNKTDSPWYPSMKIYQQRKTGDWNEVMQLVKKDLFNEIEKKLSY